jgi:hypothetical protein
VARLKQPLRAGLPGSLEADTLYSDTLQVCERSVSLQTRVPAQWPRPFHGYIEASNVTRPWLDSGRCVCSDSWHPFPRGAVSKCRGHKAASRQKGDCWALLMSPTPCDPCTIYSPRPVRPYSRRRHRDIAASCIPLSKKP